MTIDSSTIALIILVITIILFASGKVPLPVTAVGASLAMAIFGVIPIKSAFAGFSKDVTMMVIGAMIVGEALAATGIATKIGAAIIKMVGPREKLFVVVCVFISAVLSAFLSNTAVVAIMLPIVSATAASSQGKISKKDSYMAIGFASNVGGGMTLVGSAPNVVGQGLLAESGLQVMSFFDLAWGSMPRFIFMIIFYATFGYALQKRVFQDIPEDNEPVKAGELNTREEKQHSVRKMAVSVLILILTIAGFVSGIWTVGMVAMVAGIACILTGCITMKQVFSRLNWTTVWVLAGSIGFASGISESGAGKLIADTAIGWMGGNVSMFKLLVVFTLISVILCNVMSATALMAMLGPIAISMCLSLGYEAKPVIMAIVWGLNLSFLTPIATPPVTMTLQGGYRFLDYTKIGSVLLLGCLISLIGTYPFVF